MGRHKKSLSTIKEAVDRLTVSEIEECKTCNTKCWIHSHCRHCLVVIEAGYPYCEKHLVMRAHQLLTEINKMVGAAQIVKEWDQKIVEHKEAMNKASTILQAWDESRKQTVVQANAPQ